MPSAATGRSSSGSTTDHDLHEETLRKRIADELAATTPTRRSWSAPSTMRQIEKAVMLQTLDTQWKDHLAQMDYLRQGIHLRGYAQKNPKQEYKREAFEMFSAMLESIKQEVSRRCRACRCRPPRRCRRWRPRERENSSSSTRNSPG
jgi:preprotein translocase subunit SecA